MRALATVLALALGVATAAAGDMDMHDHGAQGRPAAGMDHGGMGHGGMGHGSVMPATTAIDTSTTRMSDDGHFKVSIASPAAPIVLNRMGAWEISVLDEAGKPVEGATIDVDGGMPEHGHGLPTAPRVTKDLGGGKYLVEGVKFSMTGWWQLKFGIDSGQCKDKVAFNLVLN